MKDFIKSNGVMLVCIFSILAFLTMVFITFSRENEKRYNYELEMAKLGYIQCYDNWQGKTWKKECKEDK